MLFSICYGQGQWVHFTPAQRAHIQQYRVLLNCVFLQVVKSLLDLKDEQLAVQMDAHDSLWGETGAFLHQSDKFSFLTYFCV